MTTRAAHPAALAASVLAVLSVLLTIGAGATAGVLMARGEDPDGSGTLIRGGGDSTDADPTPESSDPPPDYDYTGWTTVTGPPGDSGSAPSYKVPETNWKTFGPDYDVAFRDKADKKFASGKAPAHYLGNKCRAQGKRIPGAWTVLADTEPSGDLVDLAEAAVRQWAKGYASDGEGTTAPTSEPVSEAVTLPDGTTAGRSLITVDMSVFDDKCVPDSAEIMVTTIDTQDGAQSLVQARYLATPGVTDLQWRQISDSLQG